MFLTVFFCSFFLYFRCAMLGCSVRPSAWGNTLRLCGSMIVLSVFAVASTETSWPTIDDWPEPDEPFILLDEHIGMHAYADSVLKLLDQHISERDVTGVSDDETWEESAVEFTADGEFRVQDNRKVFHSRRRGAR